MSVIACAIVFLISSFNYDKSDKNEDIPTGTMVFMLLGKKIDGTAINIRSILSVLAT